MVTIDNVAIMWSVVIVVIALGFTIVGNTTESVVVDRVVYSSPFSTDTDIVKQSPSQITVKTDKETYHKEEIVTISGSIDPVLPETWVTLVVVSPDGNIVAIAQTEIDDNKRFSETITLGGPLWTSTGEYSVKIQYGYANIVHTSFEFIGPVIDSNTKPFEVKIEQNTFDYYITGGIIEDVRLDKDCVCMSISIDAQDDDGVLTLHLPREIINAKKSNGVDDTFIVLMDGVEIPYQEIDNNDSTRVIVIEFEQGTSDIEVIWMDPHWR